MNMLIRGFITSHKVSIDNVGGRRCDAVVLDVNDVRKLYHMSPDTLKECIGILMTRFLPSDVSRGELEYTESNQ